MSVEKFNSKSKITHEKIPFTQVSNIVINGITDLEAGFVYIYLLSKSGDWEIIKSHIKNRFKIGDKKVRTIFSYLAKRNLIKYHAIRTANGSKISHCDIEVLNGSAFISEISTEAIFNPVEICLGRKERTTKERDLLKKEKKLKGFHKRSKTNKEPKQLAKFWQPGNPDYDRANS